MTLEEFRAKYRLQQRLTQRGVASYHAVDSSGRVVMVHSLDSASREEVDHVRGMIHQLNAADRKRILEILDVDGVPVIVTEYLQAFQALAPWLEVRTRGAPAAPTVPTAPSKGPPRGEFTQLFGPAEIPKTPIVESPKSPTPTPAGGEFTQLFGAIGPAAADSHKTPEGPSTPLSPPPPLPPPPLLPLLPRLPLLLRQRVSSLACLGPSNTFRRVLRPPSPLRGRRPHLRPPSNPRSLCGGATPLHLSRRLPRRPNRRFAGKQAEATRSRSPSRPRQARRLPRDQAISHDCSDPTRLCQRRPRQRGTMSRSHPSVRNRLSRRGPPRQKVDSHSCYEQRRTRPGTPLPRPR